MSQITSRLEVNITGNTKIDFRPNYLSTFIVKNKIPAVVCEPNLVEIIAVDRSMSSPYYKIICSVDFNDGRNYGLDKVKNLPRSCLMADGFEIRLTSGKGDKETLNEMRGLTEFFKQIGNKEIRWALALRSTPPSQYSYCFDHVRKWPASFIRTDVNVESPMATLESHVVNTAVIKERVPTPIKISGNVDYETISSLIKDVARFDVTLEQAKRIIKDERKALTELVPQAED